MSDNRTELNELGEFGLIEKLTHDLELKNESSLLGVGDDAAVFSISDEEVGLISTDMLVEGVHFNLMYMPLKHLGYKAVVVNVSDICAIQPVVLTPSSTVSSVFNWYLANDYTQEITNGMIAGGVNYAIDANGVLTITGLNDVNSPYTFHVSVTNGTTSCRNLVGDLKEIQVSIIDAATPTTINTTQEFCITDAATIAQLQQKIDCHF